MDIFVLYLASQYRVVLSINWLSMSYFWGPLQLHMQRAHLVPQARMC